MIFDPVLARFFYFPLRVKKMLPSSVPLPFLLEREMGKDTYIYTTIVDKQRK